MNKKILVAYASKYGATKEIAERIGEVLLRSGNQVEILPSGKVKNLARYQAVVMGSAIYVGKWPKEAVRFLQANERKLAEQPFWLFSSGPSGEGDPIGLVKGRILPSNVQSIVEKIHPREVTLFHGNINLKKINALERWAVKNIVKKPFGDFRDWDSIGKWSDAIVSALKEG